MDGARRAGEADGDKRISEERLTKRAAAHERTRTRAQCSQLKECNWSPGAVMVVQGGLRATEQLHNRKCKWVGLGDLGGSAIGAG